MDSFLFLLNALDCPFLNEFDVNSHSHVVALVRWLEDRKIREYDIQERTMLHDSEEWDQHFRNYLVRLGCPYSWAEGSIDVLYWLASYAVSLDYDDCDLSTTGEKSNGNSVALRVDEVGKYIGLVRNGTEGDTGTHRTYVSVRSLISNFLFLLFFLLLSQSIWEEFFRSSSTNYHQMLSNRKSIVMGRTKMKYCKTFLWVLIHMVRIRTMYIL